MKTIEFTDEEVNALIQLLDIAVKAGGLQVAQAASLLAAKIGQQANPPSEMEQSRVVTDPTFAEESESSIELVKEPAE